MKRGCGYGWDGVCLAVAMPQGVTPHLELGFEEAEETFREGAFEYVEAEAKGRNEYGGRCSITPYFPKGKRYTDSWITCQGGIIEDNG